MSFSNSLRKFLTDYFLNASVFSKSVFSDRTKPFLGRSFFL